MLPRYSRYVSSSKGHVWKHQLFQLSRFNLCPNWTPNTLPQLQLVAGPEASWLSGMAQPVTDHQAMTENYVGPCGTMWDHQPINANKIFRFFSVIRVIRVINANPWRLPTYACQSDSNDPRIPDHGAIPKIGCQNTHCQIGYGPKKKEWDHKVCHFWVRNHPSLGLKHETTIIRSMENPLEQSKSFPRASRVFLVPDSCWILLEPWQWTT